MEDIESPKEESIFNLLTAKQVVLRHDLKCLELEGLISVHLLGELVPK